MLMSPSHLLLTPMSVTFISAISVASIPISIMYKALSQALFHLLDRQGVIVFKNLDLKLEGI